jgi:prepilin-type N-terminal cleavage/methylation domain-containing protein
MRGRRGFTLIEMVVAMALTMIVFAITLPFVRVQSRALGDNAGRLDAEQVARYAQRTIDEELRVAVADAGQPLIVYAGPMGIAFNANLIARDTLDPSAVELDPTADTTLAEAWRVGQAEALPLTSRNYPPTTYTDGAGSPSRNETVMFFLRPDTVTGRSDVYVLYRRVNGRDSTVVVRNIHVPADSAFFRYFTLVNGVLTPMTLTTPLFWDSTRAGTIRAVGLRSAGFYRNAESGENIIRTIHWTVMLANRRATGRDCGAAPATPPSGSGDIVLTRTNSSRAHRVQIQFAPSSSDGATNPDVTHYVIDRKLAADTVWTAIATVPARRATTYVWTDVFPTPAGLAGATVTLNYGIRAVDCGGLASARATRGSVTVP